MDEPRARGGACPMLACTTGRDGTAAASSMVFGTTAVVVGRVAVAALRRPNCRRHQTNSTAPAIRASRSTTPATIAPAMIPQLRVEVALTGGASIAGVEELL